jgi:5-methylcytosine-specific restriction endonuclease McrA
MIILQSILVMLLMWLIAHLLTLWYNYTERKRLEPILRSHHYRKQLEQMSFRYRLYDDELIDTDNVEILSRIPLLNKVTYLASRQWKDLRIQVLKRDNFQCRKCQVANVPFEIHHITYIRLGNEELSDLVTLCRSCHQQVHNKYGYSYHSTFPIGE